MRKNKIDVVEGEAKLAGPGKIAVTKDGKPVADLRAKHIILATGARARSLPGPRARRQAHLDLQGGDAPARHSEIAPGRGLGRHRHRVRELLSRSRRRRDGGRGAGPHPPGRGRGDFRLRPQIVREAGHEDPHRHHGEGAEEIGRRRQRDPGSGRQDDEQSRPSASCSPSASSATSRISASKAPR